MAWALLYIDANILIGAMELGLGGVGLPQFLLRPESRSVAVCTSVITLSEVLVGPLRRHDARLLAFYRGLFDRRDVIRFEPVNRVILEEAAEFRAVSTMKLPDSIHMATAKLSGCSILLSADKRLYIPQGIRRIDPFEQPFETWSSEAF